MTLAPSHAAQRPLTAGGIAGVAGEGGLGGSPGGAAVSVRGGGPEYVMTASSSEIDGAYATAAASGMTPDSLASMAEELCVLSLVLGLTVGAFVGFIWLLL